MAADGEIGTDANKGEEAGIPDVYYLESLEQLRALAEPLRYRMSVLLDRPMTCAGLARELGIARPKAHYHLKLLEQVGLVRFHSEGMAHGIVEKFYVVVGRMLDFSRLLPTGNALLPDNVSPETVSAVSDFLAAMLDVSRLKTKQLAAEAQLGHSHYFDFESELTPEQYDAVKARLKALKDEILAMTRQNDGLGKFPHADLVPFHLTNYLTRFRR
ncbi:MAG: hypothetical protein H6R00_484 [Proteobacteria bacterium]|nr:hypothetical protein [Pseudomonadota bacterium]